MKLDFRNTNALWCSVAAETLWRAGVRHAVISPGSRNTPLTLALVGHPGIETTPVLDERSAAFFGLGLAKRTGAPVVLLCTSGTAGANYLPAVIEAAECGTPLIIVTADRPPELRDCASGQTIDQQKLFGGFVVFYHELTVPEAKVELLRYLRQTLRHALGQARQGGAGGPVHLNAPFRDPLTPIPDASAAGLADGVDWAAFFEGVTEAPALTVSGPVLAPDFIAKRGVIIAGGGWASADEAGAAAGEVGLFAKSVGWPVLADALSGVRFRASEEATVIAAYDAILRDERAARALRPEVVLILGELPASKVLRAWLAAIDVPMVQLSTQAGNRDGTHGRTRSVRLPFSSAAGLRAAATSAAMFARKDAARAGVAEEWCGLWMRAELAAQGVLAGGLAETSFEGAFTHAVAGSLRSDQTLFVASSMPVRDLEYFSPVRTDGPRVLANRGANGIDGTLSTALGVAHGGNPVVLLTGDLGLLHDTNGWLTVGRLKGSLTVVVINNNGGGIFGHLPVAESNPHFEEYWATPQQVDFQKLCAAYGVAHCLVETPRQLSGRIQAYASQPGVHVVEVRTERTKDAALRKALFAAAGRAAGDCIG